MKKGIIKVLTLLAVFCLGVIGFGRLTNHSNRDLTAEMADATLPVVSLYTGDMEINQLRGYTQEMDGVYMRDAIAPIGKDRILPIRIRTYETKIDGISYEIRSLDMDRLVSDTVLEEYKTENSKIMADLAIQNLLEENEEYLLILKLSSGKNTIYYYTRIIEEQDCYAKECARFAMDFHAKTFDKEAANSLATYLEPDASGDNATLAKVNIHSSLKQVAWADFSRERLTTPVPSIKEINSSYSVVILDYLVTSTGLNGELEYYNVEEYYRIRYTNERMYLLNYERTMEQIFRGENLEVYDNYIQLGIRGEDVEFISNEKGNIVSFVQGGELWRYSQESGQIARVFSFMGNEGIDDRENYKEHDIRIINIDETGSMDFVVYGYMNCGIHEGRVGICLYHYDSVVNTIEEELFVPSNRGYQVMKEDLGKLMYKNSQGVFFIMVDGNVYRIALDTMQAEEYITGLKAGAYTISDSHKYFAWTNGDGPSASSVIWFADLEKEERRQVQAGSGEYLKPLGFMDEDFVYGVARESDIFKDLAGNTIFPMYQVRIADAKFLENLKSYSKDGYFVSGIEIEDYIMYLNRLQFNGMAYVEAPQDTIMNREGDSGTVVSVHTTVTEVKETQVQLSLAEPAKGTRAKVMTPKEIVVEEKREIAIDHPGKESCYYAYAKGVVLKVTEYLPEAIAAANEEMGVVIDGKQKYVWKRARKSLQPEIEARAAEEALGASSVAQCVSAMLEHESIHIDVAALLEKGKTLKEIMETAMEDVMVLDLMGCELEEALYYVNLGTPVFAMQSDTEAVLVTGYDAQNVILYDPLKGGSGKMGLSDAAKMFGNVGNVFCGYIVR